MTAYSQDNAVIGDSGGGQGEKFLERDEALVALDQAARQYRHDAGYENALGLHTVLVGMIAEGSRSEALVDGCMSLAQSIVECLYRSDGHPLGYEDFLLYSSAALIAGRLSAKMLLPTAVYAVTLAADGHHRPAWDLVLAVVGYLHFSESDQLPTDYLLLIAMNLASVHCLYDFPDYETERGAALDVIRALPEAVRRELLSAILLADDENQSAITVSGVLLAPLLLAYADSVEVPTSTKIVAVAQTASVIVHADDWELYYFLCLYYIDLILNEELLREGLEAFETACRNAVVLMRPLNKHARIELLGKLIGAILSSSLLATKLRGLLVFLIGNRGIWAVSNDQDIARECAGVLLAIAGDDAEGLAASTGHRILAHLSFQAGEPARLAKHFELARSSAPDPALIEREFAGVVDGTETWDHPALPLSSRLAQVVLQVERQLEAQEFVAALATVRNGLSLGHRPGESSAPISRRRLMALGAAAAQRAGDFSTALDFVLSALEELSADAAAESIGASRHERRRAFGQVESLASAGLRMVAVLTRGASVGSDGEEAADVARALDAIWTSLIRFRDADELFLQAVTASESSPTSISYREARRFLDRLELEGDPSWLHIDLLRTARLATDIAEREAIQSRVFVATLRRRLSVELDEVRARLPERAALVEFVDFETGYSTDEGAIYTHAILIAFADTTMVAFDTRMPLVTDDGFAHYGGKRSGVFVEPDLEHLGATLHTIVVENEISSLFVVLDGAVASLRIAALPSPDGGYLSDLVTLIHLGSAADLLPHDEEGADEREPRAELAQEQLRLAIVGAPRFDTTRPHVLDLPAVGIELEVVAARWAGVTTVLRGADVTVGQVVGIEAPAVLHVATHGLVSEGAITSDLRSTPDQLLELYGVARMSIERPMDPGIRAGLALVEYPSWTISRAPSAEPGVLTPSDMAWMNLRGTRVVVFSACRTAMRTSVQRAGALDFRAAAQAAGAHGVIAPLQDVPDLATALLMAFLYEAAPGPPGPEALREASHRLRDLTIADLLAYTDANPTFMDHPLLGEYAMWDSSANPFSSPRYWATFVYYSCGGYGMPGRAWTEGAH